MHTSLVLNQGYTIQSYKVATLTKEEVLHIIEEIRSIYLWFSPGSSDEDIQSRLYQHPNAHVDILTHTETGTCRGFSIYYTKECEGFRVMYRGGTIVADRSKGLYKELLRESVTSLRPDFVLAMTQNPRVYETLRSFSPSGNIYPSPGIPIDKKVALIASHFCKVKEINLQTLIVPNVYGSIRKEDNFKRVNSACITNFFKDHLKENDGFFVVVSLR